MSFNSKQFNASFFAEPGDQIEYRMTNDKGEPLLTLAADQFDKYMANQHAAFSEIEWDLESSKESFRRSKDFFGDEGIRSALFVDAIMAYGRVFTSAEGRSGVKLEGTSYWVGSDEISLKRHQSLMEFRHKLIAHTGKSPYRNCQTSIITSLISTGQGVQPNSLPRDIKLGVSSFKMGLCGFGDEDIDKTTLYIQQIISKVQSKKSELEAKLTAIAVDALLVQEFNTTE